jgi:hypothetical protein
MVQDGSLKEAEATERLDALTCYLMAENQKAIQVFMMVQTQWRCVEGARIGLDYNAVFPIFSMMGIPKKDRLALLGDLQTMEDETLGYLSRKREARHG